MSFYVHIHKTRNTHVQSMPCAEEYQKPQRFLVFCIEDFTIRPAKTPCSNYTSQRLDLTLNMLVQCETLTAKTHKTAEGCG